MAHRICALFCICLALRISSCVEMKARFNMAGHTGTITFKRSPHNYKDAIVEFGGFDGPDHFFYDKFELWPVAAVFGRERNTAEVCTDGVGDVKLKDLDIKKISKTIIPGLKESEYYHRTLVAYSSEFPAVTRLCATILPAPGTVTSYRAKFSGREVGTIWLRHLKGVGTYVYGDIHAGRIKHPSYSVGLVDLAMYSKVSVAYYEGQCKALSKPVSVVRDVIHYKSTTLHGEGIFGAFSEVEFFENNLGIRFDQNFLSTCAKLRKVPTKVVKAKMNWEGAKGYIKVTQASPFDYSKTEVSLKGLRKRVSGYHVHKFPVPQRLSEGENPCDAPYTSGHFNPYNIDIDNSPAAGTGTDDEYEVGDLSGKYGTLDGKDEVLGDTYLDWNLPLWGPNSIVGRSIVIHNTDGSRLLCGSIGYPTPVTTAITVFKAPAYGTMYFRQDSSNPDEDTSVFLELASQEKTKSTGHNWHIHVYPVSDDAYTDENRCQSAGPHYNPSAVAVDDPPYKTDCRLQDPLRCELGDLSGRLGTIDIVETQRTAEGKFFFTDEYLHLSGPFSVLGRSVVIHGPSRAAGRFACANITQLHPIIAKTSDSWAGIVGHVTGEVTFRQETEFEPTEVHGYFFGLHGFATSYHLHEFSFPKSARYGSKCEAAAVGSRYNPFHWHGHTPSGAGTYDQYEVGDLGAKYGFLIGQKSHLIGPDIMDTNLPLFTYLAATDKSIVVYKKGGFRWKCANIHTEPESGSNGYVISATVTFTDIVTGTIKLRQIVYEDGGAGLTSLDVDVSPRYGRKTQQHNWHVHVDPVKVQRSCDDALGHYDPYGAIDNPDYKTDCKKTNPLFCEVGDLSNKQGKYDIGGGRRAYHDVDTPLHTNYTILGRSIVFHTRNGGAARYTCANIIPDDNTYTLAFATRSTDFNRYSFTKTIADALGIARLRVVIVHNVDVPIVKAGCSRVIVYIVGGDSLRSSKLVSLVAGTLHGLGVYAPTRNCRSARGAKAHGERSDHYYYNPPIYRG